MCKRDACSFCARYEMNARIHPFLFCLILSNLIMQEREAVEGSDRSRVHALETLNTKLTSELEEVKREQDLKIVECETLKHDLKAVMQRLGKFNLFVYQFALWITFYSCVELNIP